MIRFRVEGPLEIKPSQRMNGRVIDKDSIETFWEENPELADKVGCYIFGMRSGGGLTPIYVGQSTTGFKHECFHWQKRVYYDEALAERSGTPIMFFVVKDSSSRATWLTCLNEVEDYLIQLAVQQNPDLANVKKVEWSIPGVFRAGPGHPSASAMALRQILGIVHPIEPAVQRTPEEEKADAAQKAQTDTTGSAAEQGDASLTEDDKGDNGNIQENEAESKPSSNQDRDQCAELLEEMAREKAAAKKCGLPHNQYLLLKALEDGKLHTYRGIVKATGLYSNLPAELRASPAQPRQQRVGAGNRNGHRRCEGRRISDHALGLWTTGRACSQLAV